MSIFSERLKWLREKKGLTQKDMGNLLGIGGPSYSKYEYGLREPNIDTLIQIQSILAESLDFIVGISDYDKRAEQLHNDYDHTHTHCRMLDEQLLILIADPTGEKSFVPIKPHEVQEKIRMIHEVKPDAIRRFETAKNELLDYLSTLPGVKEETLEKIKKDIL